MNHTYLLHGIFCLDNGSGTVCQVAPSIAPYTSIFNHTYGYLGPLGAVWKNKGIAKKLKNIVNIEAIRGCETFENFAIGHSNGCAIIVNALRQGAKFTRIILVNPALKVDTVFPPGDYEVLVISTENDRATKAARFFDGMPVLGWFVPDAWGAMGTYGYKGNDPRIRNLFLTAVLEDHSDVWDEDNQAFLADEFTNFLYGVY
jgi:hypothetical protein